MQSVAHEFRMDVGPVPAAVESFCQQRTAAERKLLKQKLPEILNVERLARKYPDWVQIKQECVLPFEPIALPIYSMTLGVRDDATRPTLLLTAGVHGVERIGTQVLLAWLESFLERCSWDDHTCKLLESIQIVVMPILNPTGMFLNKRANVNGVDLNRNAPVDAEDKVSIFGGGHRISRHLPWYRGRALVDMQMENQVLEKVMDRQVLNRPAALVLDLHSGFGMRDRLWFPFAKRKKPINSAENYVAFKLLWDKTYPHHNYIIEPQSLHYLSHGDIWDYFCIKNGRSKKCLFLPLTLEMGSWNWVKKRPTQLLSFAGLFNPMRPHRHSRALRRHIVLIDFLMSAVNNIEQWLPKGQEAELLRQAANGLWYKSKDR